MHSIKKGTIIVRTGGSNNSNVIHTIGFMFAAVKNSNGNKAFYSLSAGIHYGKYRLATPKETAWFLLIKPTNIKEIEAAYEWSIDNFFMTGRHIRKNIGQYHALLREYIPDICLANFNYLLLSDFYGVHSSKLDERIYTQEPIYGIHITSLENLETFFQLVTETYVYASNPSELNNILQLTKQKTNEIPRENTAKPSGKAVGSAITSEQEQRVAAKRRHHRDGASVTTQPTRVGSSAFRRSAQLYGDH